MILEKTKNKNSDGFTLLFTVLITSIVLAIALGISRVSYTELVLSSVSREGARAFYAADTGLECGLFYDINDNAFALSPSAPISCAGDSSNGPVTEGASPVSQASTVFNFFFDLPDNACSVVNVYKDWQIDNESYTRVEALGYNRDCDTVQATLTGQGNTPSDPNLVERALRATYKNDPNLGGGGLPTLSPQGQSSPS